ncbi:MAG: hypothetical protein DRP47_10085 [Candidatus Zixiibacteriota bacterium]|nr:MAG: hypothetical protein DRP47_10085 [candidate division Zixibacteria bacterium]
MIRYYHYQSQPSAQAATLRFIVIGYLLNIRNKILIVLCLEVWAVLDLALGNINSQQDPIETVFTKLTSTSVDRLISNPDH